jgi:methionyl aminopeptidase
MIVYKSAAEISKMREAGSVVSSVLAALRDAIVPGVSTYELDALAADLIRKAGGTSSFLGHRLGPLVYPAHVCVSINEEVVHGIPSRERRLEEGDLVSLDVGVRLRGFHADSAMTVPVGRAPEETLRLLEATRASLWAGIRAVRLRGRVQDISRAVEASVKESGFSIIRELAGHGVGKRLWEEPSVFNYGASEHPDPPLLEGMTLAIEPMVSAGGPEIEVRPDGWTVTTADRKPSAHFEHTIAVTRHGCEVLTLGPHEPEAPRSGR